MRLRLISATFALFCASAALATSGLQPYSVAPSTVTIAGISSGGFMAVQMHVAFSSKIHGAAIFAGGPFYCAQDSALNALGGCVSGSGLNVATFVDYANSQAAAGTIDDTSNLADQPVYLFSGTNDTVVKQGTVNALQQFYQMFSVSNLTYNNNTDAAHSWVSLDGPNSCGTLASPFINNCNIDPEQTFLTSFYGTLTAKNTGTLGGSFIQFDQTPFCSGGSCSSISMDSTGWVYVPASCASGSACKLIVVLHGCEQSQGAIGEDLVKESGVNEWADTNDLIVLYPQATTSGLTNPDGCWDFWGYTGTDYALRSGPQMESLMAMINQVTGQVMVTATATGTNGASATGTSGNASATASIGTSGSVASSATTGSSGHSTGSSAGSSGTGSSSGTTNAANGGTTSGGSGGCSSAGGLAAPLVTWAALVLLRRRRSPTP